MSGVVDMPPDENRGPEILAVCGALVGLALVVVLLRVYVRAKMVRHLGIDDYTIIGAMLVMFVEMMIIIPQVRLGGGRHVQYIKPAENITKGLHLNFVNQPLCLIALCLTKVSVGFLLRLTPSPRFRWIVIGTIIFTVLSASGNFLAVFFQCRPLALTWDPSVEGTCIPPSNLKFAAFFNSSVAVLTDILFALLPVPILRNVQMNWRVKSAVAAILSLGIFAAVAAIVKITFLGAYGQHGDFLWDSADITIWTTVEINVAIIAASFPCLKPLFKTLFDGTSARYYGSSKYKRYADDNHHTPSSHHHPISKTTKSTSTARSAGRASRRLSVAILPGSGSGAEFEMYGSGGGANSSSAVGAGASASASGSGKFSTEINSGGGGSRAPSATGSDESILPQPHDEGWMDGAGIGTVGGGIPKTSTVVVRYD